MAWNLEDLQAIGESEELQISSYRRDGSLRRWTTIWVVRVADELYVRSAYGPDGAWYRNAMRTRRARVRVGGIESDVTLEQVPDQDMNARVETAYREKYRSQPGALRPMVTSPASETTVRLGVV
ncbi:DUF2255 family protein [Kribbella sp. NPDC051137]|uniref:DUF2255 family protein n=1 Tax=Kribbella sp. NPDC051137 TaxID=3155045 RepID=UPI00343C0A6D